MTPANGPHWSNAILGQILSLCLTAGGTLSHKLYHTYGLDVAALQMTLVYLTVAILFWLALVHFSVEYFWTRKLRTKIIATSLISLLDTAASLLVIHAVAYVSLPMRALLSTISTPVVMVLSYIFLRTNYKLLSVFGAALAVGGVVFASISQLSYTTDEGFKVHLGSDILMGYGMCSLSAVLYGVSNVYTEWVTKSGGSLLEYLALSSTFSTIWSMSYLLGFCTEELSSFKTIMTSMAGVYLCTCCLSLTLFYSLLPIVMLRSSAALFNLSLLTTNFYSLAVGYWLFDDSVDRSFFISFVMVMLGLILFNLRSPLPAEHGDERKGEV